MATTITTTTMIYIALQLFSCTSVVALPHNSTTCHNETISNTRQDTNTAVSKSQDPEALPTMTFGVLSIILAFGALIVGIIGIRQARQRRRRKCAAEFNDVLMTAIRTPLPRTAITQQEDPPRASTSTTLVPQQTTPLGEEPSSSGDIVRKNVSQMMGAQIQPQQAPKRPSLSALRRRTGHISSASNHGFMLMPSPCLVRTFTV